MEIKDCFVIMPFSKSRSHTKDKWTEIFEKLFKPAWDEFKIDCYRTQVPRGSITKDIIEKLFSASIVFADLTDSNPNVMYELGVRHTFRKPSIMVNAKGSGIPFDVNAYHVFAYENTLKGLEDLKNHIAMVIQDIKKHPNKPDNPVWDFGHINDFLADHYRNIEAIQKLEALHEEFQSNLGRCDEFVEAIKGIKLSKDDVESRTLKRNSDEENKLEMARRAFFPNIRNDAITHLEITRYIDFADEDWGILSEIDDFYRWCHFGSSQFALYDFPYEGDRGKLGEAREIIRKGVNIVNRRISELKST